jgi:hypothetical protein
VTGGRILAAESVAKRRVVGGAPVQKEEGEPRPAPEDHARGRIVAGRSRRLAGVELAEELGVVGHGGEVERTLELRRPERATIAIEGLNVDAFAASETIGVRRSVPDPLRRGIERQRGMDVQIAEEGLAESRVVPTGRPILRVRERAREEEQGGRAQRKAHSKMPTRLTGSPAATNGVR